MPKIVFITVATNQEKISAISLQVQRHFEQEEPILILAPNEKAMQYLDDLLWMHPENSFLPHQIVNATSKEKIAITTLPQNLNQAKVLINVSPSICSIPEQFEMIYELYDKTSSEKMEQSQRRLETYQQKGLAVLVR